MLPRIWMPRIPFHFIRATLAPACRLKTAMAEALQSFLATLDLYTLADLIGEQGRPMI